MALSAFIKAHSELPHALASRQLLAPKCLARVAAACDDASDVAFKALVGLSRDFPFAVHVARMVIFAIDLNHAKSAEVTALHHDGYLDEHQAEIFVAPFNAAIHDLHFVVDAWAINTVVMGFDQAAKAQAVRLSVEAQANAEKAATEAAAAAAAAANQQGGGNTGVFGAAGVASAAAPPGSAARRQGSASVGGVRRGSVVTLRRLRGAKARFNGRRALVVGLALGGGGGGGERLTLAVGGEGGEEVVVKAKHIKKVPDGDLGGDDDDDDDDDNDDEDEDEDGSATESDGQSVGEGFAGGFASAGAWGGKGPQLLPNLKGGGRPAGGGYKETKGGASDEENLRGSGSESNDDRSTYVDGRNSRKIHSPTILISSEELCP